MCVGRGGGERYAVHSDAVVVHRGRLHHVARLLRVRSLRLRRPTDLQTQRP